MSVPSSDEDETPAWELDTIYEDAIMHAKYTVNSHEAISLVLPDITCSGKVLDHFEHEVTLTRQRLKAGAGGYYAELVRRKWNRFDKVTPGFEVAVEELRDLTIGAYGIKGHPVLKPPFRKWQKNVQTRKRMIKFEMTIFQEGHGCVNTECPRTTAKNQRSRYTTATQPTPASTASTAASPTPVAESASPVDNEEKEPRWISFEWECRSRARKMMAHRIMTSKAVSVTTRNKSVSGNHIHDLGVLNHVLSSVASESGGCRTELWSSKGQNKVRLTLVKQLHNSYLAEAAGFERGDINIVIDAVKYVRDFVEHEAGVGDSPAATYDASFAQRGVEALKKLLNAAFEWAAREGVDHQPVEEGSLRFKSKPGMLAHKVPEGCNLKLILKRFNNTRRVVLEIQAVNQAPNSFGHHCPIMEDIRQQRRRSNYRAAQADSAPGAAAVDSADDDAAVDSADDDAAVGSADNDAAVGSADGDAAMGNADDEGMESADYDPAAYSAGDDAVVYRSDDDAAVDFEGRPDEEDAHLIPDGQLSGVFRTMEEANDAARRREHDLKASLRALSAEIAALQSIPFSQLHPSEEAAHQRLAAYMANVVEMCEWAHQQYRSMVFVADSQFLDPDGAPHGSNSLASLSETTNGQRESQGKASPRAGAVGAAAEGHLHNGGFEEAEVAFRTAREALENSIEALRPSIHEQIGEDRLVESAHTQQESPHGPQTLSLDMTPRRDARALEESFDEANQLDRSTVVPGEEFRVFGPFTEPIEVVHACLTEGLALDRNQPNAGHLGLPLLPEDVILHKVGETVIRDYAHFTEVFHAAETGAHVSISFRQPLPDASRGPPSKRHKAHHEEPETLVPRDADCT